MKKGQTVTVFFDPITQTKKEGAAKLMHKISEQRHNGFKLETWQVKLLNKGVVCTRTIREDMRQEALL